MLTRNQIYTLLIILAAGLMFGRIIAVNRTDTILIQKSRVDQIPRQLADREQRLRAAEVPMSEEDLQADLETTREKLLNDAKFELPVFSANDRSRWNTIRVLVEPDMRVQQAVKQPDGTERTETVWYAIDKAQNVKGWDTIDMVKHDLPDQPGVGHGCPDECKICAARPEGEPPNCGYLYSSKPPLLPTLMALPYALMYWGSDGKLSLASEPFLIVRVTLIVCNLLPLIFCWFLLARLIERFGITDWGRVFSVAFICFGTFISTFAVTLNNHLPGVVCVTIAFYCVVRIVFDKETRWRYYAAAGLFGAFAVACEAPALLFAALLGLWLLWHQFRRTILLFVPAALLVAGAFFATNYIAHKTFSLAYSKFGTEWYLYEYERGGRVLESHWMNPKDLDKGEPHRSDYVFHSTIGHHGVFSLTPIWGLSLLGLFFWLFDRRYASMSAMILLTGIVVFAFYMMMPQEQRNYGGNTSALRWMLWLAPLWSVALVAAADRFSRYGFTRAIALACLIVSVMSAMYPVWNPWTMPWTYNVLQYVR